MLTLLQQGFAQKEMFLIPIANNQHKAQNRQTHLHKKDISPLVSLTEHGRGNLPT